MGGTGSTGGSGGSGGCTAIPIADAPVLETPRSPSAEPLTCDPIAFEATWPSWIDRLTDAVCFSSSYCCVTGYTLPNNNGPEPDPGTGHLVCGEVGNWTDQTAMPSRQAYFSSMQAITGLSASNFWVGGAASVSETPSGRAIIQHFNGSQWTTSLHLTNMVGSLVRSMWTSGGYVYAILH